MIVKELQRDIEELEINLNTKHWQCPWGRSFCSGTCSCFFLLYFREKDQSLHIAAGRMTSFLNTSTIGSSAGPQDALDQASIQVDQSMQADNNYTDLSDRLAVLKHSESKTWQWKSLILFWGFRLFETNKKVWTPTFWCQAVVCKFMKVWLSKKL